MKLFTFQNIRTGKLYRIYEYTVIDARDKVAQLMNIPFWDLQLV